MKSNLTLIAIVIPTAVFAQSDSSGTIYAALIALAILLIIFLALREVVMWYWKVNTIVDNQIKLIRTQQETNNLLSEQISLMKGYYKADNINIPDPIPTTVD